MTEKEWLNDDGGSQFAVVQEHASIRKLLLIAAVYVRRLQSCPYHNDAKHCDDLIEAVAENHKTWEELEEQLTERPGNWRFTHILHALELNTVVKVLRQLVAFYPIEPGYCLATSLIHEIVRNPFRPISINRTWLTPTVFNLANFAYEERTLPSGELDNNRLSILADALEDAGCDNQEILTHLRSLGPHYRGCHVLDAILGKC